MNQFPLYHGPKVKTWTWRDIKKALVGNTEQDIRRIEGQYLLHDDDLCIQGPDNLEWHISGTSLMNNYLFGDMKTEKPWWLVYAKVDAMLEEDANNEN
mgnify:CR=1 FL=1